MSFTAPVFLLFFSVVLLVYRLTPPARRWVVLLPASYLFYAWHNVWLLSLIFVTTLTSYLCALRMQRAATPRGRRGMLAVTLAVCLGILFLFKYLDFAVGGAFAVARLFGVQAPFAGFGLLLPMGISFYVFQTLSYTIDVYRGTVPAERHLGYYALFVVFFPQLVAGPIERPGDLLPQLRRAPTPTDADAAQGLCYLMRGYAKKVLVADMLAPFVDTAYGNAAAAGGAALLAATALFAIQIYCDFSGYSDIALGCARLMGMRLTENFNQPYAALSVRDFWRRWHISLTRWFTDYLYIPLGGSRRGAARRCLNVLMVFLASGLWHGAEWTFVIWGGLHGLYLIIESLLPRAVSAAPRWLRRLCTLLPVGFAWVFFRAQNLAHAWLILHTMLFDVRPQQVLAGLGMTGTQLLLVLLLLALLPKIEKLPAPPTQATPAAFYQTAALYFLLGLATLCCRCLLLSQGGDAAFLYFQF